jgi:hypothetical protein
MIHWKVFRAGSTIASMIGLTCALALAASGAEAAP